MATVITNLFSAIPWIGVDLVNLIWGGFSVDNATLNRFFSLHYLLPFILFALVIMHLIALHDYGFKGPKLFYNHLYKSISFSIPNTRSNKRIGPHSEAVLSILFGSLLGDVHGERLKSGGVRFRFKQSIIHKDFIFFLYFKLKELGYVNNNLPSFFKDKYGDSYKFDTYCYNNLLWLYK